MIIYVINTLKHKPLPKTLKCLMFRVVNNTKHLPLKPSREYGRFVLSVLETFHLHTLQSFTTLQMTDVRSIGRQDLESVIFKGEV